MKITSALLISSILSSLSGNIEVQNNQDAVHFNPQLMLWFLNHIRREAGVPYVNYSSQLNKAAQLHSKDQAKLNNLTHIGSDGSTPQTRVTREGYDWKIVAENLAFGFKNEENVTNYWNESEEFRKELINPEFKHVGFGYNGGYWTEVLAG